MFYMRYFYLLFCTQLFSFLQVDFTFCIVNFSFLFKRRLFSLNCVGFDFCFFCRVFSCSPAHICFMSWEFCLLPIRYSTWRLQKWFYTGFPPAWHVWEILWIYMWGLSLNVMSQYCSLQCMKEDVIWSCFPLDKARAGPMIYPNTKPSELSCWLIYEQV